MSLQVYDAFGKRLNQAPSNDETDTIYDFFFELEQSQATPIALFFYVDANIETQTYDGELIVDTFVPSVTWIAGSHVKDSTTILNVAIPTVGQLYAIGGREIIKKQLALMESVLAKNEYASGLLNEIAARIDPILIGYERRDKRKWPTFVDCEGCPQMVVVPSGSFSATDSLIGSVSESLDSFAIGSHEVSLAEFAEFVRETQHSTNADCFGFDDQTEEWAYVSTANWRDPGYRTVASEPVTCISWDDAVAYVEWLSRKARLKYRLVSFIESMYVAERYLRDAPPETTIEGLVNDKKRQSYEWVVCSHVTEIIDDGTGQRVACDGAVGIEVIIPGTTATWIPGDSSGANHAQGFRISRDLVQAVGGNWMVVLRGNETVERMRR